jgi:hypothetical protein
MPHFLGTQKNALITFNVTGMLIQGPGLANIGDKPYQEHGH